nr:hypothetical protein GCM10017745_47940 [Saccharothrix mutabilis subsp. capreolus]
MVPGSGDGTCHPFPGYHVTSVPQAVYVSTFTNGRRDGCGGAKRPWRPEGAGDRESGMVIGRGSWRVFRAFREQPGGR